MASVLYHVCNTEVRMAVVHVRLDDTILEAVDRLCGDRNVTGLDPHCSH